MDHRRLGTTQKCYRVGEERRRDAVDRVTADRYLRILTAFGPTARPTAD
jgi:hypothetical protein